MGKTAAVSIPPWIDEEEFRRVVEEVVKRLGGPGAGAQEEARHRA
ncbi:hypothetical protein ODS41_12715 [Pyrobaculum sp. 3827-6]|nr:hypothetical protein [Pyrobaculum sp. 3827-6]MCU7788776.1 hypothetical protein [Pyrobaculum sp. 3827-6]